MRSCDASLRGGGGAGGEGGGATSSCWGSCSEILVKMNPESLHLPAALLAVLKVLLREHVQLAVQPAGLVPEPHTHTIKYKIKHHGGNQTLLELELMTCCDVL